MLSGFSAVIHLVISKGIAGKDLPTFSSNIYIFSLGLILAGLLYLGKSFLQKEFYLLLATLGGGVILEYLPVYGMNTSKPSDNLPDKSSSSIKDTSAGATQGGDNNGTGSSSDNPGRTMPVIDTSSFPNLADSLEKKALYLSQSKEASNTGLKTITLAELGVELHSPAYNMLKMVFPMPTGDGRNTRSFENAFHSSN